MYNIEKIKNDLKNNLSEFRYEHSIRVAEEAKKLAEYYNVNEEKAYLAGIVHDIAKEFSDEENTMWIEKYNLPRELTTNEYKKIAHSYIGAVVVKELYGLDDEISNAVKYHTIGNVSMSILDKIIFIADVIGRKDSNSYIEEIRKLAYQDLDEALKQCLINQKERLESRGESFHPEALKLLKAIQN